MVRMRDLFAPSALGCIGRSELEVGCNKSVPQRAARPVLDKLVAQAAKEVKVRRLSSIKPADTYEVMYTIHFDASRYMNSYTELLI